MGFHSGNWYSFIRYDEEQDRPQVSAGLLRRVAAFAKPYWRWVSLTLVTIIGISLLSLLPPLLIRNLIDDAIPEKDVARLSLLALGMIAVPVINGLLGVAQRYASATVGEGLIFDLRSEVYAHLQRMSLRFYTHTQTGEMMSRLNNDVVGAQRAVTGTLVTIVSDSISLIATLLIMVALDWRLTLLSVAILPLFIFPARRIGRVLRKLAREQMNKNARMNALMNETLNISGALLVKIFGRYDTEVARFRERAGDVRDVGIRQAFVGRWFFLSLSLVSAIGTAMVFWVGGYLVIGGVFTLGTLVAFTAYLRNLYGPLMALTNARVDFATSMVSFERVFEVLDMPVEIQDRPNAIKVSHSKGTVRFERVSFSYMEEGGAQSGLKEIQRFSWGGRGTYVPPEKKKSTDSKEKGENGRERKAEERRWALKDLNFEMEAGQIVALVGPSGAGKSTITYLLPRLYDPTEGQVTLDGVDLRDIALDSLAGQVGMVTQETFLFHDTVLNNLLYAKDDATPEQIEEASRAAHIHEFIEQMPDGYDTLVGERGYRLSGGEKQRVAIARVILKDPKVLILDEATSHLDSRSESLIQDAMERVMKGRTSLVIAHRLSTIIGADKILVMDQGRLVEQGGHAELLAQNGLYKTLYETQFKAERRLLDESQAADRLPTATD
ncbi:MAG: ABC transporter ATP-binding protein [Anaerolineales bacterium]